MTCVKGKIVISAVVSLAPALCHAQASPDAWQFEATPYLWAAGFSGWGRIGARTPTTNVDASFTDVWKSLDVGAMGASKRVKGDGQSFSMRSTCSFPRRPIRCLAEHSAPYDSGSKRRYCRLPAPIACSTASRRP
ncbi:exported protein of unknown function (plasmid) [Caballeronia sp. S22]